MTVHCITTGVPYDSNIYLVKGRSAALIDTGTGTASSVLIPRIWDALGSVRLSMILLTHCHVDHIGGVSALVEEFGCPVYVGEIDLPYVEKPSPAYTVSDMFGIDLPPVPCKKLMEGDTFDLGGHILEVFDTPGHTAGSVCFLDRTTNDLFSGDTIFSQGYGRYDFPGGSFEQLRNSILKLSNVNIRTLYPGHGNIATDGNNAIAYAKRLTEVSD